MGKLAPNIIENEVKREGVYTPLKKIGKQYIRNQCSGSGDSLLSGKRKFPLPYGDGTDKIWTSNAKYNGKLIKTNSELGEALIYWYDYYGKLFQMDANFLIAQAKAESGFKVWNYAESPSAASGISQFIPKTIYGIIVKNSHNSNIGINMTTDEIAAITKNLTRPNELDSYLMSTAVGKANRPILHQNVIDNPEIMIKAQYRYMKYIANVRNSLASCTLFGYNRGPGYVKDTYTKSIEAAKKKGNNYEKEGVDYVHKIFKLLFDFFDYKELKMDETEKEFDEFTANAKESGAYGYVIYPPESDFSRKMKLHDAISYDLATKTDERKKHNNMPNADEMVNLKYLAVNVYDKLCDGLGVKIPVTNAFRGEFLNGPIKEGGVGGSKTSQHRFGEAMDLDCDKLDNSTVNNADVFYYVLETIDFYDQMIWEEGNINNPGWVHISLVNLNNNYRSVTRDGKKRTKNRKELLIYVGNSTYYTIARKKGESIASHKKRFIAKKKEILG